MILLQCLLLVSCSDIELVLHIIKRSESLIVFSAFDTILNIIVLLSLRKLNCPQISEKLLHLQISNTNRHTQIDPCLIVCKWVFFLFIWIFSHNLERIMDFQFFLHIPNTYYLAINCNTSTCRSLLVASTIFHLLCFKSSRKLMRTLWLKNCISYSFGI